MYVTYVRTVSSKFYFKSFLKYDVVSSFLILYATVL
jgi:hypothetical protein